MNMTSDVGKDKAYLTRNLCNQPLSFEKPVLAEETGLFYEDNGDVTIRLKVPGAEKVSLFSPNPPLSQTFLREDNNIFSCTIPWDSRRSGPANVVIFADGAESLRKELPVSWQGCSLRNAIDIPSPHGKLWEIRRNPHGAVSLEVYWSEVMRDFKRCAVYTPPGYGKSSESYPVLYMLHGGGANELDWFYAGRAASIFDNLIENGEITPFIAVAANGMVRFPDSGNVVWDDALERMLTEDVIPYIDANYRTLQDKWNRALCGLSMGSYMTNDVGFRHPELFGYMGSFTATMTHYMDFPNYERPYIKLMEKLKSNPSYFEKNYRVFFRSTTPLEDHFDYFENDDRILAEAGIDKLPCCYRTVYSELTSKWDSWRLGLHDFVQLIFK